MLGNEYEKNRNKIIKRINKIEDNFDLLKSSPFFIESDNKILYYKTQEASLKFIYDVSSKMNNINSYKNLNSLYNRYKEQSTPLAKKSRKYLDTLSLTFDKDFAHLTKKFEKEIKKQREIVFSSALLFGFLIVAFVIISYDRIIRYIETEKTLGRTKNLLFQYKYAMDNTNIVSKTNLNGKITYVNEEFCKVSLYKQKELIGKSHNIIRHENMSVDDFKDLWKTISSKKQWKGIIENKKKDGSSYFVDTTIFPILDSKGEIKEYIAIRKDITALLELNKKLLSTQDEILTRIGMIAEFRSKETSNHVQRVSEYSRILAKAYGLKKEEINIIYGAGALHDLGKITTRDDLLNKNDKLSFEEFEEMKHHTTNGYLMLRNSSNEVIKAGAIIAHEHHEKWDGSGYPRGIKGENIHIYARITAIADVFDALGSSRPYKKAWPLNEIVNFINEESGKHFDPKLVKIFNDKFDDILFVRKKFRNDV